MHADTVTGLSTCRLCTVLISELLGRKTDGLCVGCFNDWLEAELAPIAASIEGTRIPARRTRHRSGDRAGQRKRYKRKAEVAKRRAATKLAGDRAMRRLRKLMPGLYEALLAEERSKLGLEAWSMDRLLSAGDVRSSLDTLKSYASGQP